MIRYVRYKDSKSVFVNPDTGDESKMKKENLLRKKKM